VFVREILYSTGLVDKVEESQRSLVLDLLLLDLVAEPLINSSFCSSFRSSFSLFWKWVFNFFLVSTEFSEFIDSSIKLAT
jgi:hypothetical protein